MDLHFDEREQAFHDRLVRWLGSVRPPEGLRDYGATPTGDDLGPARRWQRMLHDTGWAGLSWPRHHGGQEATVIEQAIYAEELARAHLPRQLNLVGLELAGPMIIAFGTPFQHHRFLAAILRGDEVWCQLFSEPSAGSDLAGLRTATRRSGEGWVVAGQKVWTSGAHYADMGLLLARTDGTAPAHHGISCFLVPMDRPGIEVRPLRQMNGETKFNEVFLDDVELGPADLLGPPGNGWQVAVSTLGRERLTLGVQAIGLLETLDEVLRTAEIRGTALGPVLTDRWVGLWSRTRLLHLTWLRALTAHQATGADSGADATMSILKLAGSQLQEAIAQLGGDVSGPDLGAGLRGAQWRDRLLVSPGATIAGGTSEIQRNILAERVLGLPREPR